MISALETASAVIVEKPERARPAPSPYPDLAAQQLRWIKSGRYWIAFNASASLIRAVFFETADIPARLG